MIDELIAESTEYDFKVALETRKPKSWLKSVSAYANSIGGVLFFGVDNERRVVGLHDIKRDSEIISRMIKDRITPIPMFELSASRDGDKDILCLKVHAGRSTPYYYKADGIMEAYIRIGNESVVAPDYILNELILKGTNRSFDAMITDARKSDYSFTLLEATYLEQTGLRFDASDYVSFGLADKKGFLTNAGKLMADQYIVFNSRVFCTRWNGLGKGSIFDDALDAKEYEGNLLSLLRNSSDFVRNNSKVRFVKEAQYRIDKPDYAERAVTEALVNALIHRDYIMLGSEIHIDVYDDRLEIQSPGGMYYGKEIQDCDIHSIGSARRNPILADLFHRMKFMERRGSGLPKILSETAKLPGYTQRMKPEFFSTSSGFRVVLKNINYFTETLHVQEKAQVTAQVTEQVTEQDPRHTLLLAFCTIPRTREEMQAFIGITHREYFRSAFLKPLLNSGRLRMTIPDKPNSRNQKYIAF
ncbi:ATP-binding protein [uncultured Sphaerochaeta sp.]|uniref:ATP-binding protein n=1 Tax=uncultured Sphaerochaeta sp. TaxID=886478 RepID=UPI0026387D5A|nr:ATP-binding protein [uncultured Sphaerochaeta sp.]